MTNTTTIEIPRLEGETSRAYAARVEYLVAGSQRDLRSLAQKLDKSLTIVGRWSSQYGWVEHARSYDQTLATLAAQQHAEAYQKELEAHRERAQKGGRDLYNLSTALLAVCAQALRGREIEGKDGKKYLIPAMEITPNTLSIAARAMTVALDMEAHALRVADLLPRLTDDSE